MAYHPAYYYIFSILSDFFFFSSVSDDHSDYGSTVSSSTGKSPGPIFPAPTFTFPGQPPAGGVLTHKAAVYYHHQLSLQEDQGIDMTQVTIIKYLQQQNMQRARFNLLICATLFSIPFSQRNHCSMVLKRVFGPLGPNLNKNSLFLFDSLILFQYYLAV